jgi:hypothetical protein
LEITACPRCGSRRIFQGRLKDGVLTGYTSRDVCRDCGYQGSPLIFDDPQNYKNFLKGLKAEKEGEIIEPEDEDEDIEISEKEKETIRFLNELSMEKDEERKDKPKILKNSIVLISIVSIVASFWIASRGGLLTIFGFALLAVGIILFFVGILSPAVDKKYDSKITFASIFLMMAGVLSFASWFNIFYRPEQISADNLMIQQLGLDVTFETLMSFLFLYALIGIIFSILAIIGGIYVIKKKHYSANIVFAVFGILTFGPFFSSTILSFASLILIILSKNEFLKSR